MNRICVLGDTGLLGQAIVRRLKGHVRILGISTTPFSREEQTPSYRHEQCDFLDDFDRDCLRLERFKPDVIINCAALVDLKKCEESSKLAYRLNAEFPGVIAGFALRKAINFIHISTDAVFGGKKMTPYTENDLGDPVNYYGKTKYSGEKKVAESNPNALILRTNIVGLRGLADKPTFAEWLGKSLLTATPIMLADDFVTSSIHVDYFVDKLVQMCERRVKGLWHLASRDGMSKYQFGRGLADLLGAPTAQITKCSLMDLRLAPHRAPYMVLDSEKIGSFLERKMPDSFDTIRKIADDLREKMHREHL